MVTGAGRGLVVAVEGVLVRLGLFDVRLGGTVGCHDAPPALLRHPSWARTSHQSVSPSGLTVHARPAERSSRPGIWQHRQEAP
ncbi:hypothetical protein SHKM778_94030 (plasmid) [Streptomyces sp. KM77-8]|uniref:Secreted protein n=1 Tax=Streptomyces haneummycinicus TaxID=3074435 RepID=A0AAT9I0E2_9ACTN